MTKIRITNPAPAYTYPFLNDVRLKVIRQITQEIERKFQELIERIPLLQLGETTTVTIEPITIELLRTENTGQSWEGNFGPWLE